MTAGSAGAGETMQERVEGSRLKLWLLMECDRRVLTAGILLVMFASLVLVDQLEPGPVAVALRRRAAVETLFQAMTTGVVTGVTLVVSINQLVLSQELGPVGDQRDRMAGAMEFRTEAEAHLDEPVSPADPSSFLRALLSAVADDGHAIANDPATPEELAAYAGAVAADADAASDRFADAEFGTFRLLDAALDFNYSAKIFEGRRLRATLPLADDRAGRLDDLLDELRLYGPAREHFKTLYFRWELINLSRAVLYAAVPAIAVAAAMLLFFQGSASVPGRTLGTANALWVVEFAFLVTVSPFALLVSYILRIATVAKHTLAIGPFVLRNGDDVESQ